MKRGLLFLLTMAAASAAPAADPYAGYLYPSGIQAGTTARFIVGGQNLRRVRGLFFGRPGLRVTSIVQVPIFQNPPGSQRRHLVSWLDGIARGVLAEPPRPSDPHIISEWRSNVWWRTLGTLAPLERAIVERDLFTPRNALQAAPSLRQMCLVTLTAEASLPPGVIDVSVCADGGLSAPRPFTVSAAPRVREPLFTPKHRPSPPRPRRTVEPEGVVLDGQIMPGETDRFELCLTAARRYRVAVAARELQPYVGDAVPGFFNPAVVIRDAHGRTAAAADDTARFRPDPTFVFEPVASGVYTIEIHDVLYRGRADFVYAITVTPEADAARPPAPTDSAANGAGDVWRFGGTLEGPGACARRVFTVTEPGVRVFTVTARRNGSPLDAVLTLRRAADAPALAQWDDVTNKVFTGTVPQSECDPVGTYAFSTPGTYVAEIADRTGHGGEEYFWELEIRPPRPDFAVYSTRSTLPLDKGRSLKVDFAIVRRDGFTGDVALRFPKNVRARGAVATAGVDRISATVSYTGRTSLRLRPVDVWADAEVDGVTVRRRVQPCDEYEQAFAWRHLVPAKVFLLRASPASASKRKRPVIGR